MNVKRFFLFSAASILFAGCSLKYQRDAAFEDAVPQLTFSDMKLTQYSDNKKIIELSGKTAEQYKSSPVSFAQDVHFAVFDSEEKQTASGSAALVSADSKTEVFKFFDGIQFYDDSQNLKISGGTFHWNGKTEQLVSAKDSFVEIQKDNLSVAGKNFSASAVSNTFLFSDAVEGSQILVNQNDESSEKITFSGDSMQGTISNSKSKNNSTVLSGNAKVNSSSMNIRADTIELSGEEFNIIKANGDISGASSESEIEFSAQSLEYNQDTKIIILTGNVGLTDLKNNVTAKAQYVEYDQNRDVAVLQIDVDIRQKQNTCSGAYAIYRKNEQTLELSGNAVVKQAEDIFRAQTINFNMETEEISMDGNIKGSVTTTKKNEQEPADNE